MYRRLAEYTEYRGMWFLSLKMCVSQMISDLEIVIKNNMKSFLFACDLSLFRWDWG